MSLRTRLGVLAAFVVGAIIVAAFVAWRLMRATETFAVRQAAYTLNAAARNLVSDLQIYPQGRIESDAPPPPELRPPPHKGKPKPPHERELFDAYRDPLARLTAFAIQPSRETAGGFYQSDDSIIGYAYPAYANTAIERDTLNAYAAQIRAAARTAVTSGASATTTARGANETMMIVVYPTENSSSENNANKIVAAWTMQSLPKFSGATDGLNIFALVALTLMIVAVAGLALLTVRDLRSGVGQIESNLLNLRADLKHRSSPPPTPELARISAAIDELAATLAVNIAKQHKLENELQKNTRLAALGTLVAGVAHEVRNPLAAMKLKLQLAQRRIKDGAKNNDADDHAEASKHDTFRVLTEEIDRLDALVRRLLELGRPSALHLAPVNLIELARQRMAFFAEQAARQNVRINFENSSEIDVENFIVEADAPRLTEVLDNILQNALDAMPDGGALSVEATSIESELCPRDAANSEQQDAAQLRFSDTGAGIADHALEHIFEPFYTNRASGTGLGLAIAREIINAHGGELTAENVSNQNIKHGAVFTINLPRKGK